MNWRFTINPDVCTCCRTCELACAFTHAVAGKPGLSRIYPLATGFPNLWVPVTCLQCEEAACVRSCLVDALQRNPETGAIELCQEKCVRCLACTAACPFGCSLLDQQRWMVVKCDLCGGDPVCAHFCPTKALQYRPIVTEAASKVVA
jgi:carbon-monoxide dehydrogenase iron sulfur subunit